jgi:hypothetical protein
LASSKTPSHLKRWLRYPGRSAGRWDNQGLQPEGTAGGLVWIQSALSTGDTAGSLPLLRKHARSSLGFLEQRPGSSGSLLC